jgi:hypothetical protein
MAAPPRKLESSSAGLLQSTLHCKDDVRFIGSVEDKVAERTTIAEPWVGFIHQVPRHGLKWFQDLKRMQGRRVLRFGRAAGPGV